ncbi:hypothetical protein ACIGXM_02155 [Kitasatospora sp. NPDC052896]|uniref:hypothetical protein n=1 Tax=Kitasatospora sp. NPDC052896 TaxID=3364061 RepID=UPI0037C73784
MKQLVRRIGQTIALTLPVILVTTGTLAVTQVPWAATQQVVAASNVSDTTAAHPGLAPQDALRANLLETLRTQGAGAALDQLERSMHEQPSLTPYCTGLATELGHAAVKQYHGDVRKAASYARPVCDGSFAAGVQGG